MRIISGLYRGKKLHSPLDNKTRPTSDRVKENLFNILTHSFSLKDTYVLDLFAGTGALGIEALSRGAKEVVFVENYKEALKILEKNIQSYGRISQLVPQKVETFLSTVQENKFDLILMDPPYKYPHLHEILQLIVKNQWLKERGVLVLESSDKIDILPIEGFLPYDRRSYGNTSLWLLTRKEETT